MNVYAQGWRMCYYGGGVVSVIIAILTMTTLREPERKEIGEAQAQQERGHPTAAPSTWRVIAQPRIILLVIAASIRHCGK